LHGTVLHYDVHGHRYKNTGGKKSGSAKQDLLDWLNRMVWVTCIKDDWLVHAFDLVG
jgi:hypothetical protein